MKALTIWPEWAYAITHLGKDGENRTWRLFDSLIGVPVDDAENQKLTKRLGEIEVTI